VQHRQVLLQERRVLVAVVPEAGQVVVLAEEAVVAASVHFLVVRLALELAISQVRTVRQQVLRTDNSS
jgi:hypothetical protein